MTVILIGMGVLALAAAAQAVRLAALRGDRRPLGVIAALVALTIGLWLLGRIGVRVGQ